MGEIIPFPSKDREPEDSDDFYDDLIQSVSGGEPLYRDVDAKFIEELLRPDEDVDFFEDYPSSLPEDDDDQSDIYSLPH